MELCNRFDLRGQNCLYVTGIDDSYSEPEITDFFATNGDIETIVRVPNEPGQPTGKVLIEYSSDRPISRLNPATVGKLPSPKDPNVTWHVRTIREICQDELGRELAQRYLRELQDLHRSSREGFFTMLQSQLQTLQTDVGPPQRSEVPFTSSQPSLAPPVTNQTHDSPDGTMRSAHSPVYVIDEPLQGDNHEASGLRPPHTPLDPPPSNPAHVDESMFNPPHIQKVVVEHIMRSESSPPSFSQSRIRTFSGRIPKPNGEVDYDAWRTQVELLLCDPSLSEDLKLGEC